MKQKFRRGKPPFQIHERGDRPPVKHVERVPKPWKPIAINTPCPLCKKPLTRDNMHVIYLNRQRKVVHKVCL